MVQYGWMDESHDNMLIEKSKTGHTLYNTIYIKCKLIHTNKELVGGCPEMGGGGRWTAKRAEAFFRKRSVG